MPIESVKKCLPTLEKLAKAKTVKQRNQLLKDAKSCIYYSIAEISKNTLNGNIPVTPQQRVKLTKYKSQLRKLARKSGVSLKQKKEIVNQTGGAFLPALLYPVLSYLGGRLADKLI